MTAESERLDKIGELRTTRNGQLIQWKQSIKIIRQISGGDKILELPRLRRPSEFAGVFGFPILKCGI